MNFNDLFSSYFWQLDSDNKSYLQVDNENRQHCIEIYQATLAYVQYG